VVRYLISSFRPKDFMQQEAFLWLCWYVENDGNPARFLLDFCSASKGDEI